MIGLISLLKEIQGKPKAIFMAGPAGSGKSFISQTISSFQF
jgi:pantothenate kinase-related protein Tda10